MQTAAQHRAAATREARSAFAKTWRRECRVHFVRNVLAHAGRQGRRVVAAFIGTAFVQDDAEAARTQWRQVADQLRPKVPAKASPDGPTGFTFSAHGSPLISSAASIGVVSGGGSSSHASV